MPGSKNNMLIVLLIICNAFVFADNPIVPPEGYSGIFDIKKTVVRRNHDYPLSDQDNRNNWILLEEDSDEFDNNTLNTNRWYPNNPEWKGRKPTYFHPSNVSVNNGQLVISLNQHGDFNLPEGYTHTTGYIKSKQSFLYGYFEAEIQCMDAPWVSGFWLYHRDSDWWTEIDICENCPGVPENRHDLNSNVHVFMAPKTQGNVKEHFSIPKKYHLPFELQKKPHVWGLEWNEKVIRFYLDGVLFREQKNTHWHQPLEVNINCESNKWFKALPDDSKINEKFRVNYFRVWQQQSSKPVLQQISISFDRDDPVIRFAADELRHFISPFISRKLTQETPALGQFKLHVNPQLDEASFYIDCTKTEHIIIEGGSNSAVLSAVYLFLERGGFIFEVTGPLIPSEFQWDKINDWKTTIDPIVKQRGIRWHMNKPSDISAYPLEQAVEYIKNLARMRFNHVIFHSYIGQYFTGTYDNKLHRAGSLYRNEVFTIPQEPLFMQVIDNNKINCLPALEAVHDDPLKKETVVKEWLANLMKACKRMGFYIDFSFEPRAQSMRDTLKTCEDILNSYPDIDCLQLFTTESYGAAGGAEDQMKELLTDYFGNKVIEDKQIQEQVIHNAGQPLVHVIEQVCHNIKTIEELKKKFSTKNLDYRLGVYSIPLDFSQAALLVLQKCAPKDLNLAFMPQYGSRAVNDKIQQMTFTQADWQRSLIYGWIEFDGIMMMQELDVEGVRRIIHTVFQGCGNEPIRSLAFNVWKQAENRTSFRYLSLALVTGPDEPQTFFKQYAQQLGIGSIESYISAMKKLDECINMSAKTWNIGFTWTYMWSELWPQSFARWEHRHLIEMRDHYQSIYTDLRQCYDNTFSSRGKHYLDLLINRVQCSVLHMEILLKVWEVKPILMKGMDPDAPSHLLLTQEEMKEASLQPGELSALQQQTVIDTFSQARQIAFERIHLWTQNMPDRGSQGSIIHYTHCIIDGIDKMLTRYSRPADVDSTSTQRKDTGTVQPALDQ